MANTSKKSIPDQLHDLIKTSDVVSNLVKANGSASGASEAKLVCVDQAPIKCDKGSSATVLRIACHGVTETGLLAAHEGDSVYPDNFGGNFGFCSVSQKMCAPQMGTRWMLPDEYTFIDKRMDLVKAQIDAAKALTEKMQELVGKMQKNAAFAQKKDLLLFSSDKESLNTLSKEINQVKKMDMDSTENAAGVLNQLGAMLNEAEKTMNKSKELASAAMKNGEDNQSGILDRFNSFGQPNQATGNNYTFTTPKFNQTETITEMGSISSQIQALKNEMNNLKKNWIDLETLDPCEPNCQITTDSILPCMAFGGIVRFIESGQLRSLMTEDQYYQFIHMVGLYYNPKMTRALPTTIQIGDRMIQAHQFNSRVYVSNEEDLKDILKYLGINVNSNSSQYEFLKYANLYNMVALTGGSLQVYYTGPYSTPIWKIKKGVNRPSIDMLIEQLRKLGKEEIKNLLGDIDDRLNLTGTYSSGKRTIYDNHNNLKITAELSAYVAAFKGNDKAALRVAFTRTAEKLSKSFSLVFKNEDVKVFIDKKSIGLQKSFKIDETTVTIKLTQEGVVTKLRIAASEPDPIEKVTVSFAVEAEFKPSIIKPPDLGNYDESEVWEIYLTTGEIVSFSIIIGFLVKQALKFLPKIIVAIA